MDGVNCRTANIANTAKCKIRGDVYMSNTGKELRERYNKHSYDAKSRPDNNELAPHMHKYQHDFDKDIANLHLKHKRELLEDKGICLLDSKAPTRLNVELQHYRRELYEPFTDLAA